MIKKIKEYLIKKLAIPQISFSPKKKWFDKAILFRDEVIAKEYFKFIYDHMVVESLNCDEQKFRCYQQLLIDMKILSDQHWSKIKFED